MHYGCLPELTWLPAANRKYGQWRLWCTKPKQWKRAQLITGKSTFNLLQVLCFKTLTDVIYSHTATAYAG
jgi:hypothetical protein